MNDRVWNIILPLVSADVILSCQCLGLQSFTQRRLQFAMMRVGSSKQHLCNSRPLESVGITEAFPHGWCIFYLVWIQVVTTGPIGIPGGLPFREYSADSPFTRVTSALGLFLKIFPDCTCWSFGAFLERLCKLFTREPKLNVCLFWGLTVTWNVRMERLNILGALMKQCAYSVIITEGKCKCGL